METRALLAIVLSMLVLTLYQYFFVPPVDPAESPVTSQQAAPPTRGVEPPPAQPAPAPPVPTATAETETAGESVGASAPERVRVRARELVAVIGNEGGQIQQLLLPGYRDDAGEDVDLVHPGIVPAHGLFSLWTPLDSGVAEEANSALYEMAATGGRQERGGREALPGDPVVVTLRWSDGQGWSVRKTLRFSADTGLVDLSIEATAPGGQPVYVTIGPGLNPVSTDSRNVFLKEGAVVLRPDGLQSWDAGDLDGALSVSGNMSWAGLQSHYFLAAFLLSGDAEVQLRRDTLAPEGGDEEPAQELVVLGVRVPPSGLDVPLYLGPKQYDRLVAQGYDLDQVVDFGWFGIIARPLLVLLKFIYGFVGNYGVAIILLTVLLRIAFLPLNHKAMVSMRKTQRLQPQMAAIRAKYKGVKEAEKRQQMNEEIMELYRREGVSPLGGCLPMLAQLPILFSFYRLLSIAIELRGAPFALWIQDLSRYDPYLVLPLLMGGSMLVQQRMAPTSAGNPAQARMMNLMPIMFTVLFLYVPSGLVLYWLVNNLLGIGQQVYINRSLDRDAEATIDARKKGKKGQRGKK